MNESRAGVEGTRKYQPPLHYHRLRLRQVSPLPLLSLLSSLPCSPWHSPTSHLPQSPLPSRARPDPTNPHERDVQFVFLLPHPRPSLQQVSLIFPSQPTPVPIHGFHLLPNSSQTPQSQSPNGTCAAFGRQIQTLLPLLSYAYVGIREIATGRQRRHCDCWTGILAFFAPRRWRSRPGGDKNQTRGISAISSQPSAYFRRRTKNISKTSGLGVSHLVGQFESDITLWFTSTQGHMCGFSIFIA